MAVALTIFVMLTIVLSIYALIIRKKYQNSLKVIDWYFDYTCDLNKELYVTKERLYKDCSFIKFYKKSNA